MKKLLTLLFVISFLHSAIAANVIFVLQNNTSTNIVPQNWGVSYTTPVYGGTNNLSSDWSATPIAPGASASLTYSWSSLPGAGGGSGWTPFNFYLETPAPHLFTQQQSWDTFEGQTADYTFTFYASYTPTYTNYCLTAVNTFSTPATAIWYFDGTIYSQQTLAAGQSATVCSPSVETFPVPATGSFSLTLTQVGNTLGYSGGNPTFTSGGSGSDTGGFNFTGGTGTSTGNSGSGNDSNGGSTGGVTTNALAGTNTLVITATNSAFIPPTNNIVWQAPSGSASESTLEAGFSTLHNDNLNTLQGIDILHSDLQMLQTVTNDLGQVVTELLQASNNDGALQIVAAITNMAAKLPTNSVASSSTNSTLTLTNYATESTQQGISNLFAAFLQSTNSGASYSTLTNSLFSIIPSSATNGSSAQSAADSAQGDYGIVSFLSQLSPQLPPLSGSAPDMTLTIGGQTLNFDPVLMFPSAAQLSIDGWTVMLLLSFLIDVSRMFWQLVSARASTSTGGVPDLEVLGGVEALTFGGEVGGNFIGFFVACFIPAAFIFLFSASMNYLFANLGISIAQAMNSSIIASDMGSGAYYLLSSFFPVNLFFSLLCTRIILQFTLGKLFALASMAARYLFGK